MALHLYLPPKPAIIVPKSPELARRGAPDFAFRPPYIGGMLLNSFFGGIARDGVNRIPTMASATTSGVTITPSSENSGVYLGWKAADGAPSSATQSDWASTSADVHPTWKVDFGASSPGPFAINSYDILASASTDNLYPNSPGTWTCDWSDNNSTWTTVDTQTGASAWSSGESRSFFFNNITAHRYWRLNITNAVTGPIVAIGQVKFKT